MQSASWNQVDSLKPPPPILTPSLYFERLQHEGVNQYQTYETNKKKKKQVFPWL